MRIDPKQTHPKLVAEGEDPPARKTRRSGTLAATAPEPTEKFGLAPAPRLAHLARNTEVTRARLARRRPLAIEPKPRSAARGEPPGDGEGIAPLGSQQAATCADPDSPNTHDSSVMLRSRYDRT
ncbi:hypothetical protein GCM10020360_10850 [Nonlabens tegetincola]